jgi:predicted nucleic acid-binding protein
MALVVDASVAIKWFIDEPDLLAPDLLVPEVCNAAWRKVRRGESHPTQAKQIAQRLRHGVLALRPSAPLAARAMELALDLDHPVYDCFYLARGVGTGGPGHGRAAPRGPSSRHVLGRIGPMPLRARRALAHTFASGRIWPPSTTIVVPVT